MLRSAISPILASASRSSVKASVRTSSCNCSDRSSTSPIRFCAEAFDARNSPVSPSSRTFSRSTASTRLLGTRPFASSFCKPVSSFSIRLTCCFLDFICASMPPICSFIWATCCLSWSSFPCIESAVDCNSFNWPEMMSAILPSSFLAEILSGKRNSAEPSRWASRRAFFTCNSSSVFWTMANSDFASVGSSTTSACPSVTRSPSLIMILEIVPPVWCCTRFE